MYLEIQSCQNTLTTYHMCIVLAHSRIFHNEVFNQQVNLEVTRTINSTLTTHFTKTLSENTTSCQLHFFYIYLRSRKFNGMGMFLNLHN